MNNVVALLGQRLSDREIARRTGCHHTTVGSYRRKQGVMPFTATPIEQQEDEGSHVCSRCGQERPSSSFQRGRRDTAQEYRYSFCNACRNDNGRVRKSKNVESYLRAATGRLVRRARANNIEVDIDADYVIKQYHEQKGLCFYTDLPMTHELGKGPLPTNISIDKVVPALGYTVGNVVLCQSRINSMKLDATLEELREWMPGWYERALGLKVADVGKGKEF